MTATAAPPAPGERLERYLPKRLSELGPFGALGFSFSLRVTDPDMGRYLEGVLGSVGTTGEAQHRYVLVDRGPASRLRRFVLFYDGLVAGRFGSSSVAVAYLLWHVNSKVVAHSPEYLLLHAAAVEHRGIGILLPAPMDSGKTTLAAGLVQAGLRYVTDECAALHASSLELHPYPKALSIDQGSWDVLASLRPPAEAGGYNVAQWHVPPTSIRPGAVAPVCRPNLIVSPRYEGGATTELVPMRPAEALFLLTQNSFDLERRRSVGLLSLATVVRRCRAYRLRVGSLTDACEAVLGLLEDGGPGR